MDKASDVSNTISKEAIDRFLFQEGALLDKCAFSDWLQLYTEDAIYWIPSNKDDYDPNKHVSLIYDDRTRLEKRVWRLESGMAHSQDPLSRTCHMISNIMNEEQQDDFIRVSSRFMVVELRQGKQTIFSGRCEHRLVKRKDQLMIAFKKVELINNNEPIPNLSIIL